MWGHIAKGDWGAKGAVPTRQIRGPLRFCRCSLFTHAPTLGYMNVFSDNYVDTRNSSGDETTNMNFLYDDIARITKHCAPPPKLHNTA